MRDVCKGQGLGYHATDEAAVRAIDNYVKDGVVAPATHAHREGSSSKSKVGGCRLTLSFPRWKRLDVSP